MTALPARQISLEGPPNFRDLGGYPGLDGRRVKWGRVFRAGALSQLTEADHRLLEQLGLKVVCDLRTTHECGADPNRWCETANVAYWADENASGFGELGKLLASGALSAESARAAMINGYRSMPFERSLAYAEVFKRLAAEQTPLLINCAAGKDRTGVGSALILSALGVPRATILEDYLLTTQFLQAHTGFTQRMQLAGRALGWPAEVLDAVVGTEPAYLDAAFAEIEAHHGSVGGYLREVLAVDDAALQRIRAHLLD